MDAIRKIEDMPEISPDSDIWRCVTDWYDAEDGEDAGAASELVNLAIQRYASDYAAQTLASKEAELVRLREVLMNVKATLVLANEMKDGPIVDTIWHGPAETLFDYIDNSFTQPPKEPT